MTNEPKSEKYKNGICIYVCMFLCVSVFLCVWYVIYKLSNFGMFCQKCKMWNFLIIYNFKNIIDRGIISPLQVAPV